MTNKTIARIFVGLSAFCLSASFLLAVPLFIIYSLTCLAMSVAVYRRQK